MANSGSRYPHLIDGSPLADVGSGVASSLTGQYALGIEASRDGVTYKLVYNAGNSAIPPGMIANCPAGNGVNSLTVSTAAGVWGELANAVVNNSAASVATGVYFWGAKRGYLASGLVASAACVPSGSAFSIGANGNVILMAQSVVTATNAAGLAITTILSTTSGGGRNGSAIIDLA
jgi:hypothetical protein